MTPQDFTARVRAYIELHTLIRPGERVLVAVSGGVDSMVLLRALQALGHDVHVAHFDHLTRDGESTRDAEFIAHHASQAGVPCTVGRWDEWPEQDPANSFEMEARARRYAFLLDTAKAHGCKVIATGHHANDQAETVLMRTLRGTSPGGLAGIAPAREQDGLRIVRPLLSVERGEIEEWARLQELTWREDASNIDTDIERNWVRHELLPLIVDRLNPRVLDALTRLADAARAEDAFLRESTSAAQRYVFESGNLERARFAEQHEAIRRRLLRAWMEPLGIEVQHERLVRAVDFMLEASAGQRYTVGEGWTFEATESHVACVRPEDAVEISPATLTVPGEVVFLEHTVRAQNLASLPELPLSAFCNATRQLFDADVLGDALQLRTRADGDAFVPLGMAHAKKLHDYFIDRRVPRMDRDRVLLLLARDEIAWVVGHAPSALFAVRPETQRYTLIEVTPCA